MAYLPPAYANVGEQLFVEYMNERFPVTVASADSTPVFDPGNERVRAADPVLT
jgi:glycine cleavage system aminomethyltransferase T